MPKQPERYSPWRCGFPFQSPCHSNTAFTCRSNRLGSLEANASVWERFADGVCWVELASLTDATLVPHAIANALNLTERTGRAPRDSVLDFLHDEEFLLVLANCEHLLTVCAELAQPIMRKVSNARVLTTSRDLTNVLLDIPPKPCYSLFSALVH